MLSPPPGLSQSATSFIASCRQGIHQTPFSRLIRSRRRQALLRGDLAIADPSPWLSGRKSFRPAPLRFSAERAPAEIRTIAFAIRRTSRSVYFDLERLPSAQDPQRSLAGIRPTRRTPDGVSCFCSLNDVNAFHLAIKRRRTSANVLGGRIDRRGEVVGRGGVEPPTSRLSGVRSNHLSYRPPFPGVSGPCVLVEPTGIEPVTSCLQSTRSPS